MAACIRCVSEDDVTVWETPVGHGPPFPGVQELYSEELPIPLLIVQFRTLGIGISIAPETKKSPGCLTPETTASRGFNSWLYSISMCCIAPSGGQHTRQM